MILVDTSVWIDLFADRDTPQTLKFRELLGAEQVIGVGDLVVTELLQGARDDAHARKLLGRLEPYEPVAIVNPEVAVAAGSFYRTLRAFGVTIRTTVDTLIATRCIVDGFPLLYSDRDFDPFVQRLNLLSALDFNPG